MAVVNVPPINANTNTWGDVVSKVNLVIAQAASAANTNLVAGTGLAGGGALTTANVTISLSAGSIASLSKADTALQIPGGTNGQYAVRSANNTGVWTTPPAANSSSAGFMSAADKIKLDSVASGAKTGDMLKANYDPTNKNVDVYLMDNMVEGPNAKVYTTIERNKLIGIAEGATKNQTDAYLLARANQTGTQSADTLTDGSTNRLYSTAEKNKLAAIANTADVTANSLAPAIHAATAKGTPVDADELNLADSAASWGLKKFTIANLKAVVKSYLDPFYATAAQGTLATNALPIAGGVLTGATGGNPGTGKLNAQDLLINGSSLKNSYDGEILYDYTVSTAQPFIPFTGLAGYSSLKIITDATSFSSSTYLWFQVSIDNGASWLTTGYETYLTWDTSGMAPTNGVRLWDQSLSYQMGGTIYVDLLNINTRTAVNGIFQRDKVVGKCPLGVHNAVRLLASGNITAGRIFVIGYRNK